MTIIAYKDGVLAADSLLVAGSLKVGTDRKLTKIEGYMLGGCGNSEDWEIFLEWFIKTLKNPLTPRPDKIHEQFEAICIKNKLILYYGPKLVPFKVKNKFHALGDGMDLAYGAMAMGASAKQAVKVACKYNKNCSLPLQWMTEKEDHVVW